MASIKVPKKPKYCPRCGGKLVAIGNREGSYSCEDCKQKVQVLSFPRNANQLALNAINKGRVEYPFLNVEYTGVYKNMLVYEPGAMKDCCWDGIIHIFVKQNGKAQMKECLGFSKKKGKWEFI